jgi:hypothetical protein
MVVMKVDSPKNNILRKNLIYQVGDRVITNNSRLGTVVRLDKDEQGDFVVVQLDILPGEFAYDAWDLEKV